MCDPIKNIENSPKEKMVKLNCEWEKCDTYIKDNLGKSATPSMLKRAILKYVNERTGEKSMASISLSKVMRWTWKNLEKTGDQISRSGDIYDIRNIEKPIGDALISLVRHYRTESIKIRKKNHLYNIWENPNWGHCTLCWRFVPTIANSGKRRFCSHHEPRSPEYQRNKRKAELAKSIYIDQHKIKIDHPSRFPPENPDSWLKEYFPHTFEILGSSNTDITNWLSVIKQLDDSYDPKGTRETLHTEIAADISQIISLLDWCESWNFAMKKENRGGSR